MVVTRNTGEYSLFLALLKTCNNNVKYATTDIILVTCNISHKICNLPCQTCNENVKHLIIENIWEYSLFLLYSDCATSDVKHATTTSNMQL